MNCLFFKQMTPPPLPFLPLPSRSSLFDYPPIMKQQQPSPLFNQHRADSSSNNNNLYSASTIALFNSLRPLPHNQSQLITDSMINNRYYKTALCHAWQETGVCAFGGLCRYAHGDADLRSIQMVRHAMIDLLKCVFRLLLNIIRLCLVFELNCASTTVYTVIAFTAINANLCITMVIIRSKHCEWRRRQVMEVFNDRYIIEDR